MRTKEEIQNKLENRKKLLTEVDNGYDESWFKAQISILEWTLSEPNTEECAVCNDRYLIKDLKNIESEDRPFYVCKNCLDCAKHVGRRK